MLPEDPARNHLAERAARGLPILPQLRLLCTAEALAAPAGQYTLEIHAELEALCAALRESVRRRPGWLYFASSGHPLYAALPRHLLQAAVLCWVRGVLTVPSQRAVLQLDCTPQAAILVLRGGLGRSLPADTRSLLLRLAAVCGGALVQSGGAGPFTAALRLPLRHDLPLRPPPEPAELLRDRYSPLEIFLQDFCVGTNE